jgi:molybdopterin molybdotransferase
MNLLKVDTIKEAFAKLEKHFGDGSKIRETEVVSIGESVGRYLAMDISSDINVPEFRRSVVDGYAVIAKDTYGVSESMPAFLKIIGEVAMGETCKLKLSEGETVYVPTGGMLPENADGVVMIEYAEKIDSENVCIYKPSAPNQGFMNIGDDFSAGQHFVGTGHRIRSKDAGVLAACGCDTVKVFKKPKIGIISTGDEIIEVSAKPKLGEIRDINANIIAAYLKEAGAEITVIKIVKDEFDGFLKSFKDIIQNCDLLLISGGSSAGNKDFTKDIINAAGNTGVFTHGIAIKPGKPTIIGKAMSKPVFGLPGHPLSATIVYKVLVEPFIKKYYLSNDEPELSITCTMTENFHSGEGRETYQLVELNKIGFEYEATPLLGKSGSISQLFRADGYVRVDSLTEGIKKGEKVEVFLV